MNSWHPGLEQRRQLRAAPRARCRSRRRWPARSARPAPTAAAPSRARGCAVTAGSPAANSASFSTSARIRARLRPVASQQQRRGLRLDGQPVLLEPRLDPSRRPRPLVSACRSRRRRRACAASFTSRRFASSAPATKTSVVSGSGAASTLRAPRPASRCFLRFAPAAGGGRSPPRRRRLASATAAARPRARSGRGAAPSSAASAPPPASRRSADRARAALVASLA